MRLTPNQFAAGRAAFALGAGNPLFGALQNLNVREAPSAFDVLSGEIHASEVTAAIEGSRLVRDAIMGRLWQGLGNMGPAPIVFGAPAADLGARSPRPEPIPVRTFDPQVFALWGQGFGTSSRSNVPTHRRGRRDGRALKHACARRRDAAPGQPNQCDRDDGEDGASRHLVTGFFNQLRDS